jgi:osmoprotectant transport system permease protein
MPTVGGWPVGNYLANPGNRAMVLSLFAEHVYLSLVPIVLAVVISIPLGWLAHQRSWATAVLLGTSSVVYTIPSLALFVLLPAVLGTQILDPLNIVVALTIYTVALLVRSTISALEALPDRVLDAATAMGFQPVRRFLTVELPLAVPVIVAGLRVAVVSNVSLVTIGALIGIGGLGQLFTGGFATGNVPEMTVGLVLTAALALVVDAVVVTGRYAGTPWLRAVKS